jgi:hypothetical protein
MRARAVRPNLLALIFALGAAQNAFAGDSAGLGSEWSRSGFGSDITYWCKQPSCGGPNSLMKVSRFAGAGEVPELGIPNGSNIEAEFRRRPDVRRIFGAMLQQMTREGPTKGSRIASSYFTNANYVGFNFTLSNAKSKGHLVGQLRISDNKALMIGGAAETETVARRNFNLILRTVKAD